MRYMASCLAVCLAIGLVSPAIGGNPALSQGFSITNGDWIALRLALMVEAEDDAYDTFAPTHVRYDRDGQVVQVAVLGARKTVEGARESMSKYTSLIETKHKEEMSSYYGLDVTLADYELIYYNREVTGSPKEIVRMVGGQLVVPTGE